jgi:hypothetical protein
MSLQGTLTLNPCFTGCQSSMSPYYLSHTGGGMLVQGQFCIFLIIIFYATYSFGAEI